MWTGRKGGVWRVGDKGGMERDGMERAFIVWAQGDQTGKEGGGYRG